MNSIYLKVSREMAMHASWRRPLLVSGAVEHYFVSMSTWFLFVLCVSLCDTLYFG